MAEHDDLFVTIGESMILFQPLVEGSLPYAPLFTRAIAGAESNVAIGLSRLGRSTRWISRLGTDPFGRVVTSILAGEGVDTSQVIYDHNAPTGIFFKEIKGSGDPSVFYYRKGSAASRLQEDEVSPDWFVGARHLHVTGITAALSDTTPKMLKRAMAMAREAGLTISFDPNLRRKLWSEQVARQTLLELIPFCDIFMPGVDEAEFLIGEQGIDAYGQAFLQMGPKLVVLKRGEQGSSAFTAEGRIDAAAKPVDRVVDTVGAGDAYAAGFLSVYLDRTAPGSRTAPYLQPQSETLAAALQRANLLGGLAVQYRGDWEGFPHQQELAVLESGQQGVSR